MPFYLSTLILSSVLTLTVNSQSLWDYNDYNSLLFPPAFTQPFRPPIQPHPQPPMSNFQHRGEPPFNPHARKFGFGPAPPMPPTHHLESAAYRPPAAEQKFGGENTRMSPPASMNGGQFYTGRGNDYVGSSAERAALSSSNQNHGDLDSLLARIVTKLPSIADQLSQMMSSTTPQSAINPDLWLPFIQPEGQESQGRGNGHFNTGEDQMVRRSPSGVINSMPEPSSFFSFGKLLSAFTGSGLDGSFQKQVDPDEQESIDVESVKGVPILKDEDSEPEIVHKSEEELPAAHSLESNESTDDGSTTTPELIIFTLPANIEEETTQEPVVVTTTVKEEEEQNLLGSLLSGKLDRVDWLGSIFGNENNKKKQGKEGEDGNALAQLFGSNFFGSAVHDQQQDDNQKLRKYEDRKFH